MSRRQEVCRLGKQPSAARPMSQCSEEVLNGKQIFLDGTIAGQPGSDPEPLQRDETALQLWSCREPLGGRPICVR